MFTTYTAISFCILMLNASEQYTQRLLARNLTMSGI